MKKRKRPQDCIPQSEITLRIIKDYGRIMEHVDKARRYAQKMESECMTLRNENAKLRSDKAALEKKLRERKSQVKYFARLLTAYAIPFSYKIEQSDDSSE